jgi:hypothetical protein
VAFSHDVCIFSREGRACCSVGVDSAENACWVLLAYCLQVSGAVRILSEWSHLEDVAEQSDLRPLFIVQGQSRSLVPLVSTCFFGPNPNNELVN